MQNVVLVRNPQSELVLMHSGVKGMKWGVRRNLKKAEQNLLRMMPRNMTISLRVKKLIPLLLVRKVIVLD